MNTDLIVKIMTMRDEFMTKFFHWPKYLCITKTDLSLLEDYCQRISGLPLTGKFKSFYGMKIKISNTTKVS